MATDNIARGMAAKALKKTEELSSDYNDLSGKPKINGVELKGNKTAKDLNLVDVDSTNTADINISGTANKLLPIDVNESGLNSALGTCVLSGQSDPWPNSDWVVLQVGNPGWDSFQIAPVNGENTLQLRRNDSNYANNPDWTSWVKIITDKNISDYAPEIKYLMDRTYTNTKVYPNWGAPGVNGSDTKYLVAWSSTGSSTMDLRAIDGSNTREFIGLGKSTGALGIAYGGTGAANAKGALDNLNGMSKTDPTATGSFSLNRKEGSEIGPYSIAMGFDCEATWPDSIAMGEKAVADSRGISIGYYTIAKGAYSCVVGAGNVEDTDNEYVFTVGNGSIDPGGAGIVSEEDRSNAMAVDWFGNLFVASSVVGAGADYAELREWLDGNPDSEDRRGYFVTLVDDKIKIAEPGDYIEGIISANPAVLGNHDMCWSGKELRDEFGGFVYEDIKIEDEETGEITVRRIKKKNPDYDPTRKYIPRSKRPEWSAVGMLGHLNVRDDGTCQPNGYCKVAEGGIATASDKGYRVVKRVSDSVVEIVFSIYAQF